MPQATHFYSKRGDFIPEKYHSAAPSAMNLHSLLRSQYLVKEIEMDLYIVPHLKIAHCILTTGSVGPNKPPPNFHLVFLRQVSSCSSLGDINSLTNSLREVHACCYLA